MSGSSPVISLSVWIVPGLLIRSETLIDAAKPTLQRPSFLPPLLMENAKHLQLERIMQPTLMTSFPRPQLPVLTSSLTAFASQLSEALCGLCREGQHACSGQGTKH